MKSGKYKDNIWAHIFDNGSSVLFYFKEDEQGSMKIEMANLPFGTKMALMNIKEETSPRPIFLERSVTNYIILREYVEFLHTVLKEM